MMGRSELFVLAFACAGFALCATAPSAGAAPKAQADVPAGVRVVSARIPGEGGSDGFGGGVGRGRGRAVFAFADASAKPIYFSAKGEECAGACLERWNPVLAAPGARAAGQWTLIRRDGGNRQWAFQGKPVYTMASERAFYTEDPAERRARGGFGGADSVVRGEGVDGMTVARAEPATWIKMPTGLGVSEHRMAPGQVLALDVGGATPLGKALYLFTGSAAQERRLPSAFKPHYAAEMDLPVGEFTIRERADGSRQWAFRGQPLYSCDCDVDSGDVNGKDAAAGIEPAVLLRYPLPPEVELKRNPLSGGYMVEARTGRTLYYRDRPIDNFVADNTRPINGTQDPAIGATLALRHCDGECEKQWRPFLAPANAQPQGYWSIYERPDGTKQWAYKNFALYTLAGEPAGALFGADSYLVRYDDGFSGDKVPEDFGMALSWRAALP